MAPRSGRSLKIPALALVVVLLLLSRFVGLDVWWRLFQFLKIRSWSLIDKYKGLKL